ncbi:MAG: MASE1 domain-containing protein [Burkholderiales bacterium]|nr:MASE1 domain-containing protein [Burkholderiales bacterium]
MTKFLRLPEYSKRLFPVGVLAVVYYLAALLGSLLAYAGTNVSPVWPPSGIALAAILVLGYRVWPGILLGAFAASLTVFAATHTAGASTPAFVALAIAVVNTLEALLGAFLLRVVAGARSPFDQPQDVFSYTLVALFASMSAATVGVAILIVSGIAPLAARWTIWFTWWLSDAAGILIVAPVLMIWAGVGKVEWKSSRAREIGVSFVLLIILSALIFRGQPFGQDIDRLLVFLFIPAIAWAAYRYGAGGVTVVTLLISGIAVWAMTQGYGRFENGSSLNDSLTGLEVVIVPYAVTGLVLAADLAERKRLSGSSTGWRDIAIPWLTLLAGIAVTVLGWHLVASASERSAGERFEFLAYEIKSRVVDRLQSAEQILRGGAGLFAASQPVERNEWRDYVARLRLEKNFPGLQGPATRCASRPPGKMRTSSRCAARASPITASSRKACATNIPSSFISSRSAAEICGRSATTCSANRYGVRR